MKKLLLITLTLISIQGIAQQRMQRPERKEISQKMMVLTPEESAGLQTKRMTLHLDLNEFQQKEIYKINLANATKRQSTMEANRAKRESGTIEKPTKEAYLRRANDRLDDQISTKLKMNIILNAEQRAKWDNAQAHMENRFDKVMRHNKRFAQNNNFRNRRF
ncbi:hypothetical protein [Confluentibacter citreus]|uniref:hypothetical protein n=1 Tax=Confluentibacter citreus TaxID=2007307 RepID=UPI000C282104|nr:hypothetical protein [Confluentibacter citreus]